MRRFFLAIVRFVQAGSSAQFDVLAVELASVR
jgi:hypothetical protein